MVYFLYFYYSLCITLLYKWIFVSAKRNIPPTDPLPSLEEEVESDPLDKLRHWDQVKFQYLLSYLNIL